MRRTYLGEFEEIVLLMVAILDGEGYGVTVSQALEEHTGRIVTFGTVHNTLIGSKKRGLYRLTWVGPLPNEGADASACFGLRLWAVGRFRKSSSSVRNCGRWYRQTPFDSVAYE